MSFNSFGLSEALLRAVVAQGYTTPTAIQTQAIPAILAGRDLLGAAQTGTGKTAAFTLPLLQRLLDGSGNRRRHMPRALVLVPTRELAAQVAESIRTYGRHVPIRTLTVFGGAGMQPQIDALRRGVDIVVATPGRLMDHLERRTVNLSGVQHLILDEADRMLDMGFIRDIRRIIAQLPASRQNLLFSATFSKDIRELAHDLLQDPVSIDVAPRNSVTEQVSHRVYHVDKTNKRALLAHLIDNGNWGQTLVFTRTKHGADRLARQLESSGLRSAVIHGNKSQSVRTRALSDFKCNRVQILVATDIAARGLDIDALPHVVNYELPHVPEDYVHRIGRTGRAGCSGEAVSLVSGDETVQLKAIEKLLGHTLQVQTESGYAPSTTIQLAKHRETPGSGRARHRGRNSQTDYQARRTDRSPRVQ